MSDDDFIIYVVMIFIFGFILSLVGYFFLAWLGLFGIEKQLYVFANIQMVTNTVQGIVNWLILPVYIFVVGVIGYYILHKTEWNSEKENEDP